MFGKLYKNLTTEILDIGLNDNVNAGTLKLIKIGNIVFVIASEIILTNTLNAHNSIKIATITDNRFIPQKYSVLLSSNIMGGLPYVGRIDVNTNGDIYYTNISDIDTLGYFVSNICYILI